MEKFFRFRFFLPPAKLAPQMKVLERTYTCDVPPEKCAQQSQERLTHHPQRHAFVEEHSDPSVERPWCFLVRWGAAGRAVLAMIAAKKCRRVLLLSVEKKATDEAVAVRVFIPQN